ncbi:type II toxin-antitoxin system HicB family antitoxin [Desulfosporosinus nitroreducens]|uniref:type II toxin-antitoxin system HicB family antitoxin n=1 Tax=Desulfosporosinus nitroreducens TaxID=2018668 RepID=UPI00207C2A9A|nr:type II toxin-antitoxin system HicB family antitoxin [Desulfosporosinus nitroreducens]MCO1602412.1 type II toxin-antitoxin system HicB family antitoxin [Desulfosporosinus nitroreducens]
MKYVFTSFIWKDEESETFKVYFPDLPDCSAEGKDFQEAFIEAWKALGCYLYELEKNKKPIPQDEYFSNPTQRATIPIEVDLAEIRRIFDTELINKSLRIPKWLDNMAKENKINFSQTLREALKEKLGIYD